MGGGIGMGNTCKPMAVLFQCMTKFTTNKKKIKIISGFLVSVIKTNSEWRNGIWRPDHHIKKVVPLSQGFSTELCDSRLSKGCLAMSGDISSCSIWTFS